MNISTINTLMLVLLINGAVFVNAYQSDIGLNMVQLVRKYKYPIEIHKNIKTSDGYLLTMFRIPFMRRHPFGDDRLKLANSFIKKNKQTQANLEDIQVNYRHWQKQYGTKENSDLNGSRSDTEAFAQTNKSIRDDSVQKLSNQRPVVLLMHGLLGSSFDYVSSGPNVSISFLLADAGYDVWLGNARGNMYSRKHIELNPDKDKEYWEFSWHEIGVYDLPAKVDYILNVTGQQQISYIGHSQGTTVFFVFCSERPEYNPVIRQAVHMAPVAYMGNMENRLVRLVIKSLDQLEKLSNILQIYEFLPKPLNALISYLARNVCQIKGALQEICATIIYFIGGIDPRYFNKNTIPVIVGNLPAGSSVRQMFHYGQLILSGSFRQYDHGKSENLLKYNAETPPSYNLSNIVAPVGLFYAKNDWFANLKDVARLSEELSNVSLKYLVPRKSFSHVDFYWTNNVVKLVYNAVLKFLHIEETNLPIK